MVLFYRFSNFGFLPSAGPEKEEPRTRHTAGSSSNKTIEDVKPLILAKEVPVLCYHHIRGGKCNRANHEKPPVSNL